VPDLEAFKLETYNLASRLGTLALAKDMHITTAESCTGGLVAASCTQIAGSSGWFDSGFVTYTLGAKHKLLGVEQDLISHHGAVSEPVAREMALGALNKSDANISVSVTGIAGPGGGNLTTPLGTVWFGWAMRSRSTHEPKIVQTSIFELPGDRDDVRQEACIQALTGLINTLINSS